MSKWMRAALIRAIRTWAQTALATIGYGAVRIGDVDWVLVVSAATLAAIISMLMSIAGLPEVDDTPEIQQGYNIDYDELLEDAEVVTDDYDCPNQEAEQ